MTNQIAGADVTHLCATLLKGSVSQQHAADPAAYERANYIEVLRSMWASGGRSDSSYLDLEYR
jgi:hypothetical protein